jgi:hypothetical protein
MRVQLSDTWYFNPASAVITGVAGGLSVSFLGGPAWAAFAVGWLGFLVKLWGLR